MQAAENFICAGYTMYGAGTKLILATDKGVNAFQLDDELGHFVLLNPDLRVPCSGNEYSVNEVSTAEDTESGTRAEHISA